MNDIPDLIETAGMATAYIATLKFLVTQCRRCKGRGTYPSTYMDILKGRQEPDVRCPDCRELRELLAP